MKSFLRLSSLFFIALAGCNSNPPHETTGSDSTEIAKAYNKYYKFKAMSDSDLMEYARRSPEPIHSFTRREQFLEYQKHYYDSLRWMMK